MREIQTDLELEPSSADPAAISRVAARIELADIRMVWASAALNGTPDDVPEEWADRAFIGFDVHAHEWADDESFFTVRALFVAGFKPDWTAEEVASGPDYDAEDPPLVDVAGMFELTYSVEDADELSDDDLEHFAVYNSTFNAWPYWRELAQTATQRMRIRPLLVPVLKVPNLRTPSVESSPTEE